MNKVWKAGGLLLVVGALVWLATLWQWQTTERNVSMADIVLQLLVLPVLLAAVVWFAGWAVQRMRERPAAALPAAAPASPDDASAQTDAALQATHAWVVAEALSLPLGDEPMAVMTDLRELPGPALDQALVDADGLPVFTARGDAPDEIGAALDDDRPEAAWPALSDGQPWSDGARRALLRLAPVAARLVDALNEHLLIAPAARDGAGATGYPAAEGRGPAQPTYLSGVAQAVTPGMLKARADLAPLLTVRLVLPAHWRPSERDAAVPWLRERCAGMLDWVEANGAQGVRWVTDVVAEPEALWQEMDQLLLQWARDPRPQACLLLAADSAIDADTVARWQAVGALFTAQHQSGRMPGEAAAGLLAVHPAWPGLQAADSAWPRLYRPACLRRDKSADAAGRIGHAELAALLTASWPRLRAPVDAVRIVSDADHRGSRAAELYEGLQSVQPELDPGEQVVRAGVACGDTGAARALLAVTLASAAVRQDGPGAAALAILMQSSHERVVVTLDQPADADADANADAATVAT